MTWDWIQEILQELVDSPEWPVIRGPKDFPIYITNVENATFQVETYWSYVVYGKSIPEIAKELNITHLAVRKRIDKIRNYITYVICQKGYNWPYRLVVMDRLIEEGMSEEQSARALGMDMATVQKFRRRRKKLEKDGKWDYQSVG